MLQDGQGSTRQLLNSSQATVASYTTDAYGNSVSSSGSAANPFQWNSGSAYYSDSESGLQKVGARYYEPATGRWISQDSELIAGSVADSQAVNRYLYCGANPVATSDTNGHGGGNGLAFVLVTLGLVFLAVEAIFLVVGALAFVGVTAAAADAVAATALGTAAEATSATGAYESAAMVAQGYISCAGASAGAGAGLTAVGTSGYLMFGITLPYVGYRPPRSRLTAGVRSNPVLYTAARQGAG
jgi:RHS repeat-associated protein